MTIKYACFDESTDEYIPIGTFESDGDADIAAREHGLPEDGTEWYVERAVPVLLKNREGREYLSYEQEQSIGSCAKCTRELYLNDWIWDGYCIDCACADPDPKPGHTAKCEEYWDRGLDCPCIPDDVKQAIRDGANPEDVM